MVSKGQLDAAIAAYREAIRLKPDYTTAHNNLGVAFGKKGNLDEAIACYQEAIRLNPGVYQAHYNLGSALAKKGAAEAAIVEYHKTIHLKPDHADAHYHLGLSLTTVNRPDEALAAYRESIRHRPYYAAAHVNLGVALAKKGQLEEAILCYREAMRLNPELHRAHFNTGLALARKGALDEAAVAFREALLLQRRLLGDDHADTLRYLDKLISVHRSQGQHTEAEPLLRDRLKIYEQMDPDNWQRFNVLSMLGACVAGQKKFADAEPLLLAGYEGLRVREAKIPVPNKSSLSEAIERLVQLYELTQRTQQAALWRTKLEAQRESAKNP